MQNTKIIDITSLSEMLYGEKKCITEFSEAAIESFTEFRDNYALFLTDRDETNFRKAGHKIKPVAQMLGLSQIIEEYEHAKTLIWDEKPEQEIKDSVAKMNDICNEVITDLNTVINS